MRLLEEIFCYNILSVVIGYIADKLFGLSQPLEVD